jgi:hypothetical protein
MGELNTMTWHLINLIHNKRQSSLVQRLAIGWLVWESNPGGGEIFRTHPGRPWPASYTLGTGSFLGVKRPGCGNDHPFPPGAKVKKE